MSATSSVSVNRRTIGYSVCGLLALRYLYSKYVVPKMTLPATSYSNRYVVITGCDTGFGNMLSKQLHAKGFRVICGCLSQEAAETLMKECPGLKAFKVDVTKQEDIDAWQVEIAKIVGDTGVHAVVNNAGIMIGWMNEFTPLAVYERQMQVNYLGTVRVAKAMIPLLKKAAVAGQYPRIVNIASIAGRFGVNGFGSYNGSKFAVVGFTDSLRREMWGYGIGVCCIEPGAAATNLVHGAQQVMLENMWNAADPEIKAAYGGDDWFQAAVTKFQNRVIQGAAQPQIIVDDLLHAVTARYPKRRYQPTFQAQLFAFVSKKSDWFQDMFVKVLTLSGRKPDFYGKQEIFQYSS
eukprot:Clim_evm14s216 gene=Clim_evmTU14s216